jgi:anti-sigma factor RsiW
MNHHDTRFLLSAYFDGELSDDDASKVQSHLRQCAECARELDELKALRSGVRSAASVKLSTVFLSRLMRTLRGEEDPVQVWQGAEMLARRLVLAMAVIVVVIVGVGSLGQAEEPIVLGPYLAGQTSDSAAGQMVLGEEGITKEDVLVAALSP